MSPFPASFPVWAKEPTFIRLPQYPGRSFWTWKKADMDGFYLEDVKLLEAEDWQQVPTNTLVQFLLNGQLANMIDIRLPSIKEPYLYALSTDIQHAQQYPVMLVQQVIEDSSIKADAPARRPKYITFGSHGLVFDKEIIALYDLTKIGATGQQLFDAIHKILAQDIPTEKQLIDAKAWEQAQLYSQQLAALYWQYHQSILQNSNSGKRLLPEAPHVLERNGGAYVIAPMAIQSILGAYSNAQSGAKGWGSLHQKPVYHSVQNKDSAQIELRPTTNKIISAENTIQSLWQQVQKVSDLDGDVFLALLAQWIGSPKDEEGYVWISAEHILHYRGIQPRRYQASGGAIRLLDHRQDDLADIATSMERIRDTHITLQQRINAERAPGQKGRTKKRLYEQQSYIVTIAEFIRQHELTDAGTPTEAAMAIAWRFKPGSSLDAFIDGPNKQIAWFLQQSLSYDPYHEFWEKRLSRYFTFQMRMDKGSGITTISRSVGEIFEELSLPVNRSDPEKTRHRFEKAINRLCSDGQLSTWFYQELLDALPTRKWLDIWFDYHIRVTPSISSLPGGQTIRKNIP